jgi:hypothetical protein
MEEEELTRGEGAVATAVDFNHSHITKQSSHLLTARPLPREPTQMSTRNHHYPVPAAEAPYSRDSFGVLARKNFVTTFDASFGPSRHNFYTYGELGWQALFESIHIRHTYIHAYILC